MWELGAPRPKPPARPPGELPPCLAVCTKQWDVVTSLLENPHQSASPQATDSLGNTALHALVAIADNSVKNTELVTLMYDKLLQAVARLYPTVRLEDIPNLQGLTPLQLAAKEGKIEVSSWPPSRKQQGSTWWVFFCFFFVIFCLFRASAKACGGSQARGRI